MSSVVRATLSDQVHHELRNRILSGALRSGHRLLPEELALDLAISQTPRRRGRNRATNGLLSQAAPVIRPGVG